jgi:hypothetical protein
MGKRHEPEAGDAETCEVVEPVRQSLEVADAIAVGVGIGLDIEAVDDRVLVPLIAQAHGISLPTDWSDLGGAPHSLCR